MKSAVKIRLKVEQKAEQILDGQSKILNWLYNNLLETANKLRLEYIKSQDKEIGLTLYSERGLRDLVPDLKQPYPFLKTIYSSPLKNAALRLSRAITEYQKYRRGERKTEVSWPKFRSWKKKWFSLEYDEPWKGFSLEGRKLSLQLGLDSQGKRLSVELELVESYPLELTSVKQLRIVKQANIFYAIFTIDRKEIKAKQPLIKVIALDPNHKNLAYGVSTTGDGIEIENLEILKPLDRRIDYLKSRRDKCERYSKIVEYKREDGSMHLHYEPSRRWKYFNQLLDEAYRKRREQTKTFLYTIANKLCKEYECIAIGDYTPNGNGITTQMRRSMNNQSLIGKFKEVLSWVAIRSGKIYLEYEEKGTTRTCSNEDCRHEVEGGISPGIREWLCPKCNSFHIRDENAAINGLYKVMDQLNMPRSGRSLAVLERWTWQVAPSGVVRLRGGVTGSAIA